MANVLKAAWIAITAKSEPVRSYTRHCPAPNRAITGRMISRVDALEVQGAEHDRVDQRGQPHGQARAQCPVEEGAEEDLLRHRRHEYHRQRHGKAGHEVLLTKVLDVRLVHAEQLDVADLDPEHEGEGEHRPAHRGPEPRGADAEMPAAAAGA